ncbi:MAG: hypothetical protein QGG58_02235, partial [Chloroflexota bacterium]|nr:hypothetical protein [Chloroflexota bacterium]
MAPSIALGFRGFGSPDTPVAAAVGPMIAAPVMVSAIGSTAIGPAGMVGLAYTYVWAADIRTFV